jgi:hypothetical protein
MLLMCLMDAWHFLRLCPHPSPALAAENLFLRKQLALYQERQITPRRPTQATRMALVWFGEAKADPTWDALFADLEQRREATRHVE